MATKTTKLNLVTGGGVEFEATIVRTQGYTTIKKSADGDEFKTQEYDDRCDVSVTVPELSVSDMDAYVEDDGVSFVAKINGKLRLVRLLMTSEGLSAVKSACEEILDEEAKAKHDAAVKADMEAEEWYHKHSAMMAKAMSD